MLGPALWIAVALTLAGPEAPAPSPPRVTDPRLVLDQVAREPEIVTPTGLAVDSRGRILVIESHTHFRPKDYAGPPADRIRLFEDADHDGRFERVTNFFEGTKKTMNLAFASEGVLFVATRNAIYRLEDRDGDGKADGEAAIRVPTPIIQLDTPGDYPHNGLSGFAFDHAGNVHFGLGENLGADYRLIGSDGTTLRGGGEGGNIYRCRPDGSKLERIATGFWNPFHVAFDAFGRLFAVDNDPDSRPPCRLLHIVEGGDYGYRFRNGRKGLHPFTAWNGELPGTLPMVAGTGEAPCGVLAYDWDEPRDGQPDSLLVTSWGDHRIERYRLQRRGASFGAMMEPFVVGGEDFRPVGIALAPDGSVYFSDWVDKSYDLHGKGRVWRLRKRPSKAVEPSSSRIELLLHPIRELEAQVIAKKGANPAAFVRAAVLAGLTRSGASKVEEEFAKSYTLGDTSEDVRAVGARLIRADLVDLKQIAAIDGSPFVRASALRRLADPSARTTLLKALESDDPFLQQAARQGLKRSLKFPELIELASDPEPAHRLGALLILRESGRPEALTLISKALDDPDPAIKFTAIQWVGEGHLAEYRPRLLKELSAEKTTREVFEGTLAALDMLQARKREPREENAGEDYVAALLTDPGTPPAAVRRALRMLRPDHRVLTLDRIQKFLASTDESIRLEAVRTLGSSPLPQRFEILDKIAEDPHASEPIRAWARLGLAEKASGHPATVSPSPGNATQPPVNDLDAWLKKLEGAADPAAGERVFFHPKGPGCYRCHQVDGRGGRVGPDLSRLAKGMDRRRLVQSILQPSLEIAPQFVPWSVARTDGTVFTGVLVGETPEGSHCFADSEGRVFEVKPSDIEERKPQSTSIMPDNVAQTLTPQEFRDLVAFLLSSKP